MCMSKSKSEKLGKKAKDPHNDINNLVRQKLDGLAKPLCIVVESDILASFG